MEQTIELNVNGNRVKVEAKGHQTLLEILREQLSLSGTKRGCDYGDCGACTILMDDQPVNSCLILAVETVGKAIITIEGLWQNGKLHPVQQAFMEHNAVQCGFCTPGMILTTVALLKENPHPTAAEIRHYLQGNLCRCTGYNKILAAIRSIADDKERQEEEHGNGIQN